MALDQNLIGFWKSVQPDTPGYYEITPSGKLFSHYSSMPYELSSNGSKLRWHKSSGIVTYRRHEGLSAELTGNWTLISKTNTTNQISFGKDENFLYMKNYTYHGHFELEGDYLSTNIYKGQIATICSQLTHILFGQKLSYFYDFKGTHTFRLCAQSNQLIAIYNRHLPF